MTIVLPEPSLELAESMISEFDRGNQALEEGLAQLIARFPRNEDLGHVLVKVAAINTLYGTQIRGVFNVAKLIESRGIDPLLEMGSVEAVKAIERVTYGEKSRSIYSFATKYCNWHRQKKYPIYDSRVSFCLLIYKRQYKFHDFDYDTLRQYEKFLEVVDAFRKQFRLESLSYKQFDKFLYQLGDQYFPSGASASSPPDVRAESAPDREIVLEVAGEGGSITLWREKVRGEWQFRVETDEGAVYESLSEEDRAGVVPQTTSTAAQSWELALAQLDKFPWPKLAPIQIHPDFAERILAVVDKRGGQELAARWRNRIAQIDKER